ncbi:hypothetical protein GJ744_009159 [Endocarpon pusillum]|uniref:Uncharacterized protein n=1 Tax=Endocarpon pusillum TaxID=364733 RepID=A0A8H7AP36_9EURO|nr:hypothetical protein GJ744_009159 [Endocarpon pusillum]
MAHDQSIMINGTIGTEGFSEPRHVRIVNNVTTQQATMISASISEKTWSEARQHGLDVIRLVFAHGPPERSKSVEMLQEGCDSTRIDRVREGRVERFSSQ